MTTSTRSLCLAAGLALSAPCATAQEIAAPPVGGSGLAQTQWPCEALPHLCSGPGGPDMDEARIRATLITGMILGQSSSAAEIDMLVRNLPQTLQTDICHWCFCCTVSSVPSAQPDGQDGLLRLFEELSR